MLDVFEVLESRADDILAGFRNADIPVVLHAQLLALHGSDLDAQMPLVVCRHDVDMEVVSQ